MGHYDGNIVYYRPIGENADGLSGVTFAVGRGEKSTNVPLTTSTLKVQVRLRESRVSLQMH